MKTRGKAELQQARRRARKLLGKENLPGGKELPAGKGATDRHRIKDYKAIVRHKEDEEGMITCFIS